MKGPKPIAIKSGTKTLPRACENACLEQGNVGLDVLSGEDSRLDVLSGVRAAGDDEQQKI